MVLAVGVISTVTGTPEPIIKNSEGKVPLGL